jgi:DNA-binding NtrC family response regulator
VASYFRLRDLTVVAGVEGRRILIIEDEKVVADTLAQILAASGYETRVAYSAEHATEIVSHWTPQLAIVDVILPKMDGIELALLLRGNVPGCRVLLFSGQPSVEAMIQKARSEGHEFEILAKPVHPAVMLEAVSSMLAAGSPAGCPTPCCQK